MIDIFAITDAITDHLSRTGLFARVANHEPISAPGKRLTGAVWPQGMQTMPGRSGLASTTLRLEFFVRLYLPAGTQPYEGIDPEMLAATNELWNIYSGGFTLDGLTNFVDLLGAYGTGLQAAAGYLEQDGNKYRVMTIVLPLILDDAYEQAP